MNRQDILTNLEITCKQNNETIENVFVQYLHNKLMGIYDDDEFNQKSFLDFKKSFIEEAEILADMQPTIEENEEQAFAIQHILDIYDLLGGESWYEQDKNLHDRVWAFCGRKTV